MRRAAAAFWPLALLSGGCLFPKGSRLSNDPVNYVWWGAGVVTQVALHELAHTAYAEAENIRYTTELDGVSYRFRYKDEDPDKIARVGRMGYIADTLTAEVVPWIPRWREKPFLNGLYWGSIMDRGKATLKNQGDVELIDDFGGPSEDFTRGYFATSVAVDLARFRWPDNPWIVGVSAGLHGYILVRFSREF